MSKSNKTFFAVALVGATIAAVAIPGEAFARAGGGGGHSGAMGSAGISRGGLSHNASFARDFGRHDHDRWHRYWRSGFYSDCYYVTKPWGVVKVCPDYD
jgi:hypothetical protein